MKTKNAGIVYSISSIFLIGSYFNTMILYLTWSILIMLIVLTSAFGWDW